MISLDNSECLSRLGLGLEFAVNKFLLLFFTQISTDKRDIKIQFEHFNDNKINSVFVPLKEGVK